MHQQIKRFYVNHAYIDKLTSQTQQQQEITKTRFSFHFGFYLPQSSISDFLGFLIIFT